MSPTSLPCLRCPSRPIKVSVALHQRCDTSMTFQGSDPFLSSLPKAACQGKTARPAASGRSSSPWALPRVLIFGEIDEGLGQVLNPFRPRHRIGLPSIRANKLTLSSCFRGPSNTVACFNVRLSCRGIPPSCSPFERAITAAPRHKASATGGICRTFAVIVQPWTSQPQPHITSASSRGLTFGVGGVDHCREPNECGRRRLAAASLSLLLPHPG